MTLKEIQDMHVKVAAYIKRHTELTFEQMAQKLNISRSMISYISHKYGVQRRRKMNRDNAALMKELDN